MPMTQIWDNDRVIAVTPISAGPCTITQVKTVKKDSYSAIQLAFGNRKAKNLNKAQRVKYAKAGISPMFVKEIKLKNDLEVNIGDQIQVDSFSQGDIIQVTGISKGKGFQGVVKRHGFKGGHKSHGNKDQLRMPGSVGSKGPAHIFKGVRMAGRMGNERVTVSNLKVALIDVEKNIIYVQGAVPGAINSLIQIKASGEMKIKPAKEINNDEVKEEVKEEVKA